MRGASLCFRGGMKALVPAVVLCAALVRGSSAHPLAPALLELSEDTAGAVAVRWKTSLWKPSGMVLEPQLPPNCKALTQPEVRIDEVSMTAVWTADCGAGGLAGTAVAVRGAESSATDTVLRIRLRDGRVLQEILRGGQARYEVPRRARRGTVISDYLALGVHHISGGADHLLFVFGLLVLVPSWWSLTKTVTAFTAGHSVTLTLAALGYARLPAEPIEVVIAATILALAVELARPSSSSTRWRPWAMAFLFGLLHGLGFAGALAEIGLPAGEIPAALLAFNAGIEIGQLAFIGAVLSLLALARRMRIPAPRLLRQVSAYGMGCLSVFWLLQRVEAWLV